MKLQDWFMNSSSSNCLNWDDLHDFSELLNLSEHHLNVFHLGLNIPCKLNWEDWQEFVKSLGQ